MKRNNKINLKAHFKIHLLSIPKLNRVQSKWMLVVLPILSKIRLLQNHRKMKTMKKKTRIMINPNNNN